MSKKYPGKDTEFAKWTGRLAKLDNQLKKERDNAKKEINKEGGHKGHKRQKDEEE